jgi:hypothetical protein
MSKSNSGWNNLAIGIVSVFLGFVAFAFTQSIFNLFFVAFIVGVFLDYVDKVRRLEVRLLQLEARLSRSASGEGAKPSDHSTAS